MKKSKSRLSWVDYDYYKPREVSSFAAEVGKGVLFLLAISGWTYFCLALVVD